MAVNYNDERFDKVESEKSNALNEVDKTYGDMIAKSDDYFQDQIDATEKWEKEQTKIQNEKTDFAIKQINQQKDQANKDYIKEQSASYVDWQQQSNQYGANAEQVAAGGLAGSGFSESSQVSMYNTYQNRVAAAREAYSRAVLNYDNAIKEAQLQNSSILAEIAYETLQKQLELSLQGFQYKNTLILEKANKRTEVERDYYGRYQDVLSQINAENALEETRRQFDQEIALEREKLKENQRQFNRLHSSSGSSGGVRISKSSNKAVDKIAKGAKKLIKTSKTTKDSEVKSNEPEVDMDSVEALGRGPISEAELDRLVSSGIVEEYVSNGKIRFRYKVVPPSEAKTVFKTPSKSLSDVRNGKFN